MGRKEKKEEKMTGEFNLCCLIFLKKFQERKEIKYFFFDAFNV